MKRLISGWITCRTRWISKSSEYAESSTFQNAVFRRMPVPPKKRF